MVDIIVIGAGTAGMTAALYALRNGKSVLVLEAETFGGQISFSPRVENYPSIKQISGSEFSENLMEQIIALGAEVELERVTLVEQRDRLFKVTTEYNEYECKSVILAVGVKHRHIGVPMEEELLGKGVSYCSVCDGAFYAGEEVALIGDANTALQYSILLSNYCKKVYVLTLFDKFFGEAHLVKILRERKNVEIRHNLCLQKFVTDGNELCGLEFKNTQDDTTYSVDVKACFISIGQVPENKVFENIVELDKQGYIIAGEDCCTATEGLYVAGDCRTKKIRQLTTATADGATAAVLACSYVDRLD
jgi:thioredoxin reductase (NADPH)